MRKKDEKCAAVASKEDSEDRPVPGGVFDEFRTAVDERAKQRQQNENVRAVETKSFVHGVTEVAL